MASGKPAAASFPKSRLEIISFFLLVHFISALFPLSRILSPDDGPWL
jgi:hypothetical protein